MKFLKIETVNVEYNLYIQRIFISVKREYVNSHCYYTNHNHQQSKFFYRVIYESKLRCKMSVFINKVISLFCSVEALKRALKYESSNIRGSKKSVY